MKCQLFPQGVNRSVTVSLTKGWTETTWTTNEWVVCVDIGLLLSRALRYGGKQCAYHPAYVPHMSASGSEKEKATKCRIWCYSYRESTGKKRQGPHEGDW